MLRTGTAYFEVSKPKHPGRTTVALVVATVAIAPVVAFAALWACCFLMLGVMWAADAVGFI